jgi:hypothetical protein
MATRRKRSPWLTSDIRELKSTARKASVRTIGRTLKRTEGAVRQKAFSLGVSLDSRRCCPGKWKAGSCGKGRVAILIIEE